MEKYLHLVAVARDSGGILKNISKAFVWSVPLENPRQDNFKLLRGQMLEKSGGKQGQLTNNLRFASVCINVIGSSTHA